MRTDDAPRYTQGWIRSRGVLARAHNRLGEHTRARELCLDALADCSEEDLDFVVMTLNVQLELAIAEAALGEHARARKSVERLLERHSDRIGPILLGAIHETCARVALLANDYVSARVHSEAMRSCFASTESATLFELAEQLAEQISNAERSAGSTYPSVEPECLISPLGDDADLTTRTHLSHVRDATTWAQRAKRGLRLAQELTEAQTGFVLSSAEDHAPIALGEEEPDPQVIEWAQAVRSGRSEVTADMPPDPALGYLTTLRNAETLYCLFPLELTSDLARVPAVLVLGFHEAGARVPDQAMLVQLARSLRTMLR